MPTPYIRKLEADGVKSKDELEKAWAKAKKIASEESKVKNPNYAYVTAIFKKIAGIKESASKSFKDYLNEASQ